MINNAIVTDSNIICWYPMRVTYGREQAVSTFLSSIGVENYLPMTERSWRDGKAIRHKMVPAISNLLFVHDSRKHITELKHTRQDAEPLRYITRPVSVEDDDMREIIIVPDRQMENFMRVADGPEEERTFLTAEEMHGKSGDRVVVTSGPFAGVEGVIKRIHGNKRVTIELEGVGGVCINFVPKSFVMKVTT